MPVALCALAARTEISELAAGPSSGASCMMTSMWFRIIFHSFGKGLWTKGEGDLLYKGDGGAV